MRLTWNKKSEWFLDRLSIAVLTFAALYLSGHIVAWIVR
jgi:hypothetical protein